jgi:hypothetical protein
MPPVDHASAAPSAYAWPRRWLAADDDDAFALLTTFNLSPGVLVVACAVLVRRQRVEVNAAV